MRQTLGIRNLNPLNIRVTKDTWQGQIQPKKEGGFCEFSTLWYGLRAAVVLLFNYRVKYGLKTVRGIISRWAPPADNNDTESYIQYVCRNMDVKPDETLDFKKWLTFRDLYFNMAMVESGLTMDEMITPQVYELWRQQRTKHLSSL